MYKKQGKKSSKYQLFQTSNCYLLHNLLEMETRKELTQPHLIQTQIDPHSMALSRSLPVSKRKEEKNELSYCYFIFFLSLQRGNIMGLKFFSSSLPFYPKVQVKLQELFPPNFLFSPFSFFLCPNRTLRNKQKHAWAFNSHIRNKFYQ